MAAEHDDGFTKAKYDYLMEHDAPGFLDGIARHLLRHKPADMHGSVLQYLTGLTSGGYAGGVIVAGENVGGGWARVINSAGQIIGEIDQLPFKPDAGMHQIAVVPKEETFFIVTQSATAGAGALRKYSYTGTLLLEVELPRPATAIMSEGCRGVMYVGMKSTLWVLQYNGSKLKEFAITTPLGIRPGVSSDTVWILTARAIERRSASTGQLESAVHLPESMTTPCAFVRGEKHVWVASPNADGTANYVGAFDFTGRSMAMYVPSPGCLMTYDTARGGMWQMPRQSVGTLAFHNEKGIKVMTIDVGKHKVNNVVCDRASGRLWLLRVDFVDECKAAFFDPMRNASEVEVALPAVSGTTTHMAAA